MRNRIPSHRLPAMLLVCCAMQFAQADPNPYYIGLSQSFSHSSNLLRLPDGTAAPAGTSSSDTVSSTSLLAGIDQPFGRQHAYGNLALRENKLSKNTTYDNQGYSFTGGLDWSTADRISGSVKATADRNLASFNADQIGLLLERNLQTTQQLDASIRAGVVTALTAELTVGGRSVDYTARQYQTQEFRQGSASLGLRWRPSAQGSLGLALRQTKGRYPTAVPTGVDAQNNTVYGPDRFDRRDLDLSATLVPSAVSNFDGRLSFGRTRYEQATQRDFSGVTGLLRWTWQPTGKLRVTSRLSRDPDQSSYFFQPAAEATVDYSRLTTALRERVDFDLSAKISLNASLAYAHRSLVQNVPVVGSLGDSSGTDHSTTIDFGAMWVPTQSLQFGCDLTRERRLGNSTLSASYGDTTASCYGQFTLQ